MLTPLAALDRGQSPDDIFAQSRMSFGDHIEELRKYLLRAIYGLLVVLFGGLILDQVGEATGQNWLGLGRPMLEVIKAPAEEQVRAFYARRNDRKLAEFQAESGEPAAPPPDPAEVTRVRDLFHSRSVDMDQSRLSAADRATLRNAPVAMPVRIPVKAFEDAFGIKARDPAVTEIPVTLNVYPAQINFISNQGEMFLENRQFMKTQSAQEAMVVYFKVSILSSFVLASPWIFYQLWAFIAAGLYPHERAYVYKFLAPSIGLFFTGVLMCQFIVLPGAVKALIGFNNYVDLDPDLRLNEWLGFAMLLPIVFGISFQTPLVMFFFNRIGTFGWQDYWAKWKYALLILAMVSAIITPSPDAITMMYLLVPMCGLYLLGIAVCRFFPPRHELEDEEAAAAEQVGV
jgi:sec-independent protein translocase protein TatC